MEGGCAGVVMRQTAALVRDSSRGAGGFWVMVEARQRDGETREAEQQDARLQRDGETREAEQ